MKNQAETILKIEDKPIVEEMVEFLKTLNEEQQKQVGFMIRGLKMGLGLKEEKPKSAVELASKFFS